LVAALAAADSMPVEAATLAALALAEAAGVDLAMTKQRIRADDDPKSIS
jgi:hypothetical protein